MQFFRHLPIKRKLMVITMLVSGAALVVACAGFIAYDQAAARKQMGRNLAIMAAVTSANCTAGLSFDDPSSVEQALHSLAAQPHITQAWVYDQSGRPFARYLRGVAGVKSPPPLGAPGHRFDHGQLKLFQPIVLAGEPIGTIYLQEDLSQMTARLWHDLLIVALMLVAAAGVAFFLSIRLQGVISKPLSDLARIVTTVANEKNYSVRAAKSSDDELGRLIDGFNEMLAQIQERDANLEHRVVERTRDLAESLSVLNATLGSTADGIVVVNAQRKVIIQNRRAVDLWKMPPAVAASNDDQLHVRHVTDAVADPARFAENVAHYYSHPDQKGRDEIELKDGTILERITAPVLGPDKKIYGRIWTFRDVTQSRRAEEELRQSQALYTSLVEQLPAGIFRKDLEGRYVLVNSWFCRLRNLRPEQILGKTPSELAAATTAEQAARHPQAVELLRQGEDHHRRILRTGCRIEADEQYPGTSGQPLHLHVIKSPVFGPDTAVIGSQGILLDVTEQKQAEAELAYERELLRSLLDKSEDTIYFKDLESRFIRSSTAQARQFKVASPEALVGRCDADFFTDEHARAALQDEQEIIRTGKPLVGKLEKETWPDGRVTWALTNKLPLRNAAGETIGTFGISKDITELKEAQERAAREQARLKFIFDSVPVGISLARNAPDGQLLERMINDAHLRICGLTREQDAKPATYRQITHPDDHRRQMELARQVDAGHLNQFSLEKRYLRLDGKTVWVNFSFQRRRLPDGTFEDLCTVADITAIKRAEEEREKLNRQLVDTSRQAGMAEVATSVLHNVGNVLNSINVSTTLVLDRVKKSRLKNLGQVAALIEGQRGHLGEFFTADPRGQQLPDYLVKLAEHLAAEQSELAVEIELTRKNIEHIKDIVTMQQNYAKVSGVVEKVKVTDLVEDALRMNAGALARHDVHVVRDYPAEPVEIHVERQKVLQILVNLVRNAKYACDDSGRPDKLLTLKVRPGAHGVRIAVLDNGVGIPAENLTRIFNHGFTTRENGHGFGLHSGALTTRELGGTLTAHSDGPGTGAEFVLELPLQPPRRL